MPTVDDFLDEWEWLLDLDHSRHPGWRVEYGWTDRCDPWDSWAHETDCSGSICGIIDRLMRAEGNANGYPCQGSFAMSRRAHQMGLGIPIEEARHTPGAMLFIGANEGQGLLDGSKDGKWDGHVGSSVGNGTQSVEARGHVLGVGYYPWNSHRWDWASKPFPEIGMTAPTQPKPRPDQPTVAPMEDDMILMPNTAWTPAGLVASARIIGPPFNFVLLESGARVIGDHQLNVPETHTWQPPKSVAVKDWEIIGAFTVPRSECKQHGMKEEPWGYLVARYAFPSQATGTYATPIVIG